MYKTGDCVILVNNIQFEISSHIPKGTKGVIERPIRIVSGYLVLFESGSRALVHESYLKAC